MLLFPRYFCHVFRIVPKDLQYFSKNFQFISKKISVPFKFKCAFSRYTKRKMQIFYPTACGNAADTGNGSQLMSYSHAGKDLNED